MAMAMARERMKNVLDGEGEGKRSRPSSSSFLELEENEILKEMVEKQMRKMRVLREILKDRMEKQMREMKDATEKHMREAIIEIIEMDVRETEIIMDQMREKREMRKKRMREMREQLMMSERLIWEKPTREKQLFELLTLWELWDEEEEMRELTEMRETRSVWRMDLKEIIGIWMREMEIRDMRKKRKMREMEKLKYPCLLGRGTEGEGPVLYLFNLDDDERNKEEDEDTRMRVLTPASMLKPEYYYMSVVVGTVVYVLGGVSQDVFHNKVFFFDINYPEKGWIMGPDMLNDRCNGKAVAVEGKIYVFGGNNKTESDSRPWAEFLDPITNKWEPLPAPPEDSRIDTRDLLCTPVVYGGPGEGKKIFLSWCHHIYHVDAQTWERFHCPESLYPFSHNLTSNGNILYWTTDALFFSFNMKTEDIDYGLVEGYMLSKYREELLIPEPTLLHLGGDHFCFITLKDLPGGRTKVRCTKFRVSHQGGLKGSVVCCETYIIGHPLDMDYSYAFAFPIFAEIVPVKSRMSIYALDRSFETVLAAFASPIVGLLAQRVFGYKPIRNGSTSSEEIETDRKNAASLTKALYAAIGIPFTICLIYSFLHCTYPRDRDHARMQTLIESEMQQMEDSPSVEEYSRIHVLGFDVLGENKRSVIDMDYEGDESLDFDENVEKRLIPHELPDSSK